MIGNVFWNIWLGLTGFLLTFTFSLPRNLLWTTFIRSVYSFVSLFVFAWLLRWLLGTVVGLKKGIAADTGSADAETSDAKHLGRSVDMVTPEDRELADLLKHSQHSHEETTEFAPLRPPRLTSKIPPAENPQELAAAVRRLSEE